MTGAVFRGFGKLKNAGPCRAICGKPLSKKLKTTMVRHTVTRLSVMESSRTCPWPRGSSRTISIVLGLGLVGYVLGLGLVDKVVRMLSDLVNRDD